MCSRGSHREVSDGVQYSISKIGWPHGFGHTVIALHTVIRYTRLFGWIWGKNVSGNPPIESGRVQGCFFSGKMVLLDSGSQFLDSGSPPRALGRAQGYFFSEKLQSGILEALREHQGVLKAFFF